MRNDLFESLHFFWPGLLDLCLRNSFELYSYARPRVDLALGPFLAPFHAGGDGGCDAGINSRWWGRRIRLRRRLRMVGTTVAVRIRHRRLWWPVVGAGNDGR